MTALTVTTSRIGALFPEKAEIYTGIAGTALAPGDAVYFGTAGKLLLSDGKTAATAKFHGIVVGGSASENQGVAILKRGHIGGFATFGTTDFNGSYFLSNTVGKLDDTAGSVSVTVGQKVPLSDSSLTASIYIDADWN